MQPDDLPTDRIVCGTYTVNMCVPYNPAKTTYLGGTPMAQPFARICATVMCGAAAGLVLLAVAFRLSEQFDANLMAF